MTRSDLQDTMHSSRTGVCAELSQNLPAPSRCLGLDRRSVSVELNWIQSLLMGREGAGGTK